MTALLHSPVLKQALLWAIVVLAPGGVLLLPVLGFQALRTAPRLDTADTTPDGL